MVNRGWIAALSVVLSSYVSSTCASLGDSHPLYRFCVRQCLKNGCAGNKCFSQCYVSEVGSPANGSWYSPKFLYFKWNQLECLGECRYNCMLGRERERQALGEDPIKYHGKWPFKRTFGLQEPVSVALSLLNLVMHIHGWLSFFILVYYKLPLKQNRTYYEYTFLWHVYALLSVNAWFWSSLFHFRDIDFTEKLDYSSAVAVLGYSLIVSVMRSFHVRDEATRVMVAAPLLAFTATHILFLNFYKIDYGWNMQVCVVIAVAQLLIWAIWAGVTRHPSRWKLWAVVIVGGLAMLIEIYDFPPYEGFVDAHAVWHAITIPLTYLWWSFIKDDAKRRTFDLVKKAK